MRETARQISVEDVSSPSLDPQPQPQPQPQRSWSGFRHRRCVGRPVFRDRAALDLSLILDLDPDVAAWECLPPEIALRGEDGEIVMRVADFRVFRRDGSTYRVDAVGSDDREPVSSDVEYSIAERLGSFSETAVRNARGIMAHVDMIVPLSDQVRLLSKLDELDTLGLLEAAALLDTSDDPIGTLFALAANGIVRVDYRSSIIGPRTAVSRARAST